jgi:hypothetical protein
MIFEFSFVEGGLYEYPMKNILRTKDNSNIKVDI